nr:lactobacillus shifted protein [Quercus suber]
MKMFQFVRRRRQRHLPSEAVEPHPLKPSQCPQRLPSFVPRARTTPVSPQLHTMLHRRLLPAVSRRVAATSPAAPTVLRYSTTTTTDNPIVTNQPNPKPSPAPTANSTNNLPVSSEGSFDKALQESSKAAEQRRVMQAPNRRGVWSKSQQEREKALVGPRFEQTIMEDQPRPLAAIELIHKQPVRWTKERVVSCDGGGGPLGHPRIFINVDKPKINWCTYCGLPFAHEHHRKHLESLPSTSYPLGPSSDAAALPQAHVTGKTGSTEPYQSNSGKPLEQR